MTAKAIIILDLDTPRFINVQIMGANDKEADRVRELMVKAEHGMLNELEKEKKAERKRGKHV